MLSVIPSVVPNLIWNSLWSTVLFLEQILRPPPEAQSKGGGALKQTNSFRISENGWKCIIIH